MPVSTFYSNPCPISRAAMHLSRHVYKRGAHKGDAPADGSRRGRSHHRIIALRPFTPLNFPNANPETRAFAVRFHYTDILTITPGADAGVVNVEVNTGGWDSNPTTREALRASSAMLGVPMRLSTKRIGGQGNPELLVWCATSNAFLSMPLRDGMTLTYNTDTNASTNTPHDPTLTAVDYRTGINFLPTWVGRRADRAERSQLREELKASGFLDMLPILHANMAADPAGAWGSIRASFSSGLELTLTNPDNACLWPDAVAKFGIERVWDFKSHTWVHRPRSLGETRKRIMACLTERMTETYDVPVNFPPHITVLADNPASPV